MILIQAKNHRQVYLRRLNANDFDGLFNYLQNLSAETKKRFGPHPFDKQSIVDFYENSEENWGYVAQTSKNEIVAYAIIKMGYLENDKARFDLYGLTLDNTTNCEFAPSVADDWQSCGIGNQLFQHILSDLKKTTLNRVILWGGVQAENDKAINYYKKNGFKQLGQFTHNGLNLDMILHI